MISSDFNLFEIQRCSNLALNSFIILERKIGRLLKKEHLSYFFLSIIHDFFKLPRIFQKSMLYYSSEGVVIIQDRPSPYNFENYDLE